MTRHSIDRSHFPKLNSKLDACCGVEDEGGRWAPIDPLIVVKDGCEKSDSDLTMTKTGEPFDLMIKLGFPFDDVCDRRFFLVTLR